MNKMELILEVAQLMMKVVEDTRALADSVQAVCKTVMEGLSEEHIKAAEVIAAEKKKPSVSLEQVRGILAAKSQAGHTAEVRAIITKHGASRLSEIDEADYAEVMKEAEELK